MTDSALTSQEEIILKKRLTFRERISKLIKRIMDHWQIYLLLLPLMIWLFLFAYRPMRGLVMAFQNFSPFLGISGSPWVGLANFENLLFGRGSAMFWRAVRNTFTIGGYQLIFGFPAPIILAIMFHELKNGKFKNISQSILLLPNFLSEVIIAGIVIAFLQPTTGVINHFLMSIGVINEGIFFLTRAEWFRSIFVFIGVWAGAGFSSLIFYSSLLSVPHSLYEAAELDGATRIQRIIHISIPGILPTIAVMFIMAVGGILNVGFERVLLLYQPVTYETADVIATYVFRLGLEQNDFALGATAGLLNSFVALILVIGANTISKKLSSNSLW